MRRGLKKRLVGKSPWNLHAWNRADQGEGKIGKGRSFHEEKSNVNEKGAQEEPCGL